MAVLTLEVKHNMHRYTDKTQHFLRAVLANTQAMPPTQQQHQETRTKQVPQMQQHNDGSKQELGSGRHTLYLDRHCVLVVLVGGERLALLGGYNCVTSDELGHDTANSLNTHGQSCHIQQQHLVCLQHAKL